MEEHQVILEEIHTSASLWEHTEGVAALGWQVSILLRVLPEAWVRPHLQPATSLLLEALVTTVAVAMATRRVEPADQATGEAGGEVES